MVKDGLGVYYYDPYEVADDAIATLKNLENLSYGDYEKYERLRRSKLFAEKYLEFTGRNYLSMYAREKHVHYMWRANYIGEKLWVTTKETHFLKTPPERQLVKIQTLGVGTVANDKVR